MKLLLPLLLCLLPILAGAQYTELENGRVAAEQGDYKTAIQLLETVLQNPGQLSESAQAQAAYFHGLSLLICWQKEAFGSRGGSSSCEMALPRAWQSLKLAQQDAAWKLRADKEIPILQSNLLYSALNIMLAAKSGGETDAAKNQEIAKSAEPYLKAALEIGESWRALDLEGQRLQLLSMEEEAKTQYQKAIQSYEKKRPEVPDFALGNSFFRVGEIHLRQNRFEEVLAYAENGQKMIQSEWERYQKLQAADPNFKVEDAREQYDQVKSLLLQLELSVYVSSPELGAKALPRLEEIMKQDADNVLLLSTFANFAQSSFPEKAIEAYDRILELDPQNFHAAFNRGAIHLNRAAEISQQLQTAQEVEQQFALSKQLKDELRLAKPLMERAHKIDTNEPQTLDALVQICTILEDEPCFTEYAEKRKKLKGM